MHPLINRSVLRAPEALNAPNAWIGHIPFAMWLVEVVQPQLLVELGTHSGNSYFSFCQSVLENHLKTRCYAVDTWRGDEQAGYYGNDVHQEVAAHNATHYQQFSRLLRMTFDEALSSFEDGSIDLLHIDGLHTYEAVRHDFETWLPKLSDRGIILFHDIAVRDGDFGVWRLWEELSARYPHVAFEHTHGLGVLLVGEGYPAALMSVVNLWQSAEGRILVEQFFRRLGRAADLEYQASAKAIKITELEDKLTSCDQCLAALRDALAGQESRVVALGAELADRDFRVVALGAELADRDSRIVALGAELADRDSRVAALGTELADRDSRVVALGAELADRDSRIILLGETIAERDKQISEIYGSKSWLLTKPLRDIRRLFRV